MPPARLPVRFVEEASPLGTAGALGFIERRVREGVVVGLANHTALVARDGTERPIEDSAAPIRDERGELFGEIDVLDAIDAESRAKVAAAADTTVVLEAPESGDRLFLHLPIRVRQRRAQARNGP